jgi:hypothetical protein
VRRSEGPGREAAEELERENQKLTRIVADRLLENEALLEIARGNW